MDLNNLLFPCPKISKDLKHTNELIYIPKFNLDGLQVGSIPCIFIYPMFSSDNFLIYFHGNAEDIFLAYGLADELKIKLNVSVVLTKILKGTHTIS